MAVIYNDYLGHDEVFDVFFNLDSSGYLTTPISTVPCPYSGYGFIGNNSNGTLTTLTFRAAGTVEIELGCYNVLYQSYYLHNDSNTHSIYSGQAKYKDMFVELYNTGTNTCVYSKNIQAPGPGSDMIGDDYVRTVLNVTAAGTYDLKIRCQTAYTFHSMGSEGDEKEITSYNVSDIQTMGYLHVDAEDSYTQTNYVEGYLYDEEGFELSGVAIVLKENTSISVLTDLNGYYKLTPLNPTQLNTGTLVVNGLPGYKTLEFPIQGRSYMDIYLELEEDEPVTPEPEPEPERPNLPGNKIVTVQNIVDFLTGNDKTVFANNASSRGYSSTKCPPIWIIDAIISSTNISLSVPSFITSTKNKLVKYSDLSEGLYTMRFMDLDQMIDFHQHPTDYQGFIASDYDKTRYDGSGYPTSNLFYGENNTLVGTKDQGQDLYNTIYNEEAESNRVVLISEEEQVIDLSNSFYNALYELAFGTAKQQNVYISPLYTLTIQDWDDWVGDYSDYDNNWIFAESITGPFFDGDSYPTSNLYYYGGDSTNTIDGYIWQGQNLIDYVDSKLDGEWEYLGFAVPDDYGTDSYHVFNVSSAIQNIVAEESDQVANILETTAAKSVTVDSSYAGGWVLDNSSNPSTSLYDMYKSNAYIGEDESVDMMRVQFSGYDTFTIYIRSCAEAYYDYVVASNLNYILPTSGDDYPNGPSDSTMSGAMAMTKGNQQCGTELSNYTPVTYSGLNPNAEYYITVAYRKDSSAEDGDDRGYVLIPKVTSAPTGTYYVPVSYIRKGWMDDDNSVLDVGLSGQFSGGSTASICTNRRIVDGYGNSGNGDEKTLIGTFGIPSNSISSTYIRIWGSDYGSTEGRIYVVKVSTDGTRQLVSAISYIDEFGGSSVYPQFNISMVDFKYGDSYEIGLEQGDNPTGIYNGL